MGKNLPIYTPLLDEAYNTSDEILGVDLISNTATPAVRVKGVAFSQQTKKVSFTDNVKYRIAAPVMIPGDVYRQDDEEYYIRFTPENIEVIAKDFMSKMTTFGGSVFNVEHTDSKTKSYILESLLVDSPQKAKMIRDSYNLDIPVGSFFVVQQFTDPDEFYRIVEAGMTGFSLEAFFALVDEDGKPQEEIVNKLKQSMKNKKVKHKFAGTKRVVNKKGKLRMNEVAEGEEVFIVADELKEGETVTVVEDITEGGIEGYTGEVEVVIDEVPSVVVVEEGVISEIAATEVYDEKVEVKVEDKVEVDTKAVEKILSDIYDVLADIKTSIDALTGKADEKTDVVVEETIDNASRSLMSLNRKKN